MSVINKMLRDLDSRHGAALPVKTQPLRSGIARDTLIIADSSGQGRRRDWQWVAVVLSAVVVAVVGAAAAWWYLNQNTRPPRVASTPASAAMPVPTPTPTPVSSVPAAVSEPVPVAVVAPRIKVIAQPMPAPVPTVKDRATLAQTSKPAPAASVGAAVASAVAGSAVSPPAPRPSPALDALAQGQALWNAGSRVAAIDLLRDALLVVERSTPVGAPADTGAVLAALARELARMQLAQGQVREALELLTRLEPALSEIADVWAMRGNAAQRLGQHGESAVAYQTALKLRPGEPRWQLGAAVSLAAQGQLAAAAELAEQARAAGALSPEVAAYLRQSGVILRER